MQFTLPILSFVIVPVLGMPFLRRRARRLLYFVICSFVLFSVVALAGVNPDIDVQATFISKHLFLPSYALLAILIGFGLVILLDGIQVQKRMVFRGIVSDLAEP
jgi:Ni/Fe-hydrogenase subunit HybB-like protein